MAAHTEAEIKAATMFAQMTLVRFAEENNVDPDDVDIDPIFKFILNADLPRVYCKVMADAIHSATLPIQKPPLQYDELLKTLETKSSDGYFENEIDFFFRSYSFVGIVSECIMPWDDVTEIIRKHDIGKKWNHIEYYNVLKLGSASTSLFPSFAPTIGFFHAVRDLSEPNSLQEVKVTCLIISNDLSFSPEKLQEAQQKYPLDLISRFKKWNKNHPLAYHLNFMFKRARDACYGKRLFKNSTLSNVRRRYQSTLIVF